MYSCFSGKVNLYWTDAYLKLCMCAMWWFNLTLCCVVPLQLTTLWCSLVVWLRKSSRWTTTTPCVPCRPLASPWAALTVSWPVNERPASRQPTLHAAALLCLSYCPSWRHFSFRTNSRPFHKVVTCGVYYVLPGRRVVVGQPTWQPPPHCQPAVLTTPCLTAVGFAAWYLQHPHWLCISHLDHSSSYPSPCPTTRYIFTWEKWSW